MTSLAYEPLTERERDRLAAVRRESGEHELRHAHAHQPRRDQPPVNHNEGTVDSWAAAFAKARADAAAVAGAA